MQSVKEFVERLASAKPVGYAIGSKYTGKREFLWDSRTGVYSESLPLIGYDEWLIQMSLVPSLLVKRRKKDNIRQKG